MEPEVSFETSGSLTSASQCPQKLARCSFAGKMCSSPRSLGEMCKEPARCRREFAFAALRGPRSGKAGTRRGQGGAHREAIGHQGEASQRGGCHGSRGF